ncbi:MAG TPA: protein kinase [Polyangiaceae bacterium]
MGLNPNETTATEPTRIADRFSVRGHLGRGGMATVFRVYDEALKRDVALKQISRGADRGDTRHATEMFEREFNTLSSLAHPSIIEVYDYGVDESGPYYTMELLDGGDLRERSPVPWREACRMLHDVCSSLALLHSRRLVHRDVSPRNIRCTRDGRAKLIDFGAMVPMGPGDSIVGTPAFVAPEVVHLSQLDARTDLFSFGATLYFALVGRMAFPARDFVQLLKAWDRPPIAPSRLVADIPEALEALVLSLLSVEPAMRPRTAFEVMQRLAAMIGMEHAESAGVSRAYLSTPSLVGRAGVLASLRGEMKEAFAGRGRSVFIEAKAGLGRTRVLDQAVFEAKAQGATVVRARASFATTGSRSLVEALGEQLLQALPELAVKVAAENDLYSTLFEIDERSAAAGVTNVERSSPLPRLRRVTEGVAAAAKSRATIVRWILEVSRRRPLLVAVDDVHRIEDAAATLTTFVDQAPQRMLLVLATAETEAALLAPAPFQLLERSKKIVLEPLDKAETEALFLSLFGDVPNVGILGHTIHDISGGNPRACLDLAQHLLDTGAISYVGGTWSLPSRLDATNLPESADAAIRARIAGLSAVARAVAQSQALVSQNAFAREEYVALCRELGSSEPDAIITELVENQVLTSDGRFYTLAHVGWASSLRDSLSATDKVERHRALAALLESRPGLESVRHMLEGGQEARGLDRLFELVATIQNSGELRDVLKLDANDAATTFSRALDVAVSLGRSAREINTLRRWIASIAVAGDESLYWQVAPAWLEQLKQDSGFNAWESLRSVTDVAERRARALGEASQRYGMLTEAERVYRLDEAIRILVHYVAISIAIGARTLDVVLIDSLPELLEPFAPLAPGVDAILQNAIATRESRGFAQPEHARRRWVETYERLAKMTPDQVESLDIIRQAIAFGIAAVEAGIGLPSATTWVELLERDPLQRIQALYLRKIVRLQQGDWEGAEHFRRKAEMLELSARERQMFTSSLLSECDAHSLASDLTGLRQVIDRIQPLARKFRGWVPYEHVALGRFERIRGNLQAARREFESALALSTPDPADATRQLPAFPPASAGLVQTLTALDAHAEALRRGEQALAICADHGMGVTAYELARSTALVDAKLGNFERAVDRLERIIAEQIELGVTGLNLGASYEARALVAIGAKDAAAVEKYTRLTAREYRHGRGSPLGARYERLMEEAAKASSGPLPSLDDFEPGTGQSRRGGTDAHETWVTEAMSGADQPFDRGQRALRLLCKEQGSEGGHLYLFVHGGLTHVASVGNLEPPEGLLPFLKERLEVTQDDVVTMTIAAITENHPPLRDSTTFVDETGIVYGPVMLTCGLDGEVRHAGIAVLTGGRPGPPSSSLLVSAVSAHLIRCGDTNGVIAGNANLDDMALRRRVVADPISRAPGPPK